MAAMSEESKVRCAEGAFREANRFCPGCLEASALRVLGRVSDNGRKTVFALGTTCSQAGALHLPDAVAWGRGEEEPEALSRTVGILQVDGEEAVPAGEGVRDVAEALAERGAWSAPAPNVLCVTADEGGVAAGLGGLLQALQRGRPMALFVLLHEVFGAGRLAVPATSVEPGREPLDPLLLAMDAGARLVAQVSPAYPDLLAQLAAEALQERGPAVVFVPAPCLAGRRIDADRALEVARLACETGVAPCLRWRRGARPELLSLPPRSERPGVEEYLARQGRFEALARLEGGRAVIGTGREAEVAALQAWADRRVERLGARG